MGYSNGEVKVRETPSLFWRPTADKKKKLRPWLRDYWTVAMTTLTYRSFYHLNADGHFLLQESK